MLPPGGFAPGCVLLGVARPSSRHGLERFARTLPAAFRLVVSYRVYASKGNSSLRALLRGERVMLPRRRRLALFFAAMATADVLEAAARRCRVLDEARGAPPFYPIVEPHNVMLRPVVSSRGRHPLSASCFDGERDYDLVLDLFPGGDALVWRGGCFLRPYADAPDNLPMWVSGSSGALRFEDFVDVVDFCAGGLP